MPGRHGFREAYIKCPFYRNYNSDTVRCEGIMDGTTLGLSFADTKDRCRHMDVFCQTEHFRKCEIYRMVMDARYEEE